MRGESVTFWELPQFIVAVSPRSGSTAFARAYPGAVKINPRKDLDKFKNKGCVYYMRNPLSRLVSAYKGFVTTNKESNHRPPDAVMMDFSKFVDYTMTHGNPHWDPVYPFMDFITEVRHFSQYSELVKGHQENKSAPLSVFINHETFAKIASYWCRDFLIYATITRENGTHTIRKDD